jgi:hypothetical protein
VLQKQDYEEVEFALTRKLLQTSPDGYVACPNPKCANIGFQETDSCGEKF